MDIEFDFKGDPVGGVITKCKHCFSAFDTESVYVLFIFIMIKWLIKFTHFYCRLAGKGKARMTFLPIFFHLNLKSLI